MEETLSVKQAAKRIGKAPNTLRTWSGTDYFGEYLSPYANPEPGIQRRYTERDIQILRTATILQKRGLQIVDIVPRLAAGEILEELPTAGGVLPPAEPVGQSEEQEPSRAAALVPVSRDIGIQIELFLKPYDSQIQRLTAEIERDRQELEQERERRIAAEIELARLSGMMESRSKPWYKRLFG